MDDDVDEFDARSSLGHVELWGDETVQRIEMSGGSALLTSFT